MCGVAGGGLPVPFTENTLEGKINVYRDTSGYLKSPTVWVYRTDGKFRGI